MSKPTIDSVRQFVSDALTGFARDPADSEVQFGYHEALRVIASEALGMDPGPNPSQPPVEPKKGSHLRLVS